MYILNPLLLKKGDVILARFHDNRAKKMMKASGSKFSHAMLYWKQMSILDASDLGVHSENIQRIGFENKSDVVVLRLKTASARNKITEVIDKARTLIGTKFSLLEACRTKVKFAEYAIESNRQFCTRFIAQSFANAGIHIVNNPDYCSPNELLNSVYFEVLEDVIKIANKEELKILESEESATYEQLSITNSLLEEARKITNKDVQTLEQICSELIKNPSLDRLLLDSLNSSGYLDLGVSTFAKVPWLFNESAFHQFLSKKENKKAICIAIEEIAEDSIRQFDDLYSLCMRLFQEHKLQYFFRLATHYLLTQQFFIASKEVSSATLKKLN